MLPDEYCRTFPNGTRSRQCSRIKIWIVKVATGISICRYYTSASGCRKPMTCMASSDCTQQHEAAKSRKLNNFLIFPCDLLNNKRGVCCPLPTRNRLRTDVKRDLLPTDQCGLAFSDRILNGKNASLGQFPWMALIGAKYQDNPEVKYGCAGSIINNRYVLTAAHCVNALRLTVVHVRLGEHDTTTPRDCDDFGPDGNGECADPVLDVPVEKVIWHRNYSRATLQNDIALLRLRPLLNTFTQYVYPICLPFGVNDTGAEENKYMVAGWGRQSSSDHSPPSPNLMYAHVDGISPAACRLSNPASMINDGQICADNSTLEDACKGDSGGPLMRLTLQQDVQTFLVGVVSFALKKCDEEDSPTAYTRVYHYLNWILENIQP